MSRPRKFKKRDRNRRAYTPTHDGAHVRCRSCQTRRTLGRLLSTYFRVPRCNACGVTDWRVDHYRARKEVGQGAPRPCRCAQYHFPHFKGRGMCVHNPNVDESYAAARGRA